MIAELARQEKAEFDRLIEARRKEFEAERTRELQDGERRKRLQDDLKVFTLYTL